MTELVDPGQPLRKFLKPVLITFLLFTIGSIAYLTYSGVQVQYHLSRVKSQVQQANSAGSNFNGKDAAELLTNIRVEVAEAHKSSTGLIWWIFSHTPYIGRTPTAIRTVTGTLNDTLSATNGLESKLSSGANNSSLRDFKFLLSLSDSLVSLRKPVADGAQSLSNLRLSGVPSLIASPVKTLTSGYQALAPITADAEMFSTVAPSLLGLDRPRKWMLVFQNGAEARSVGGFPGGWGILTADAGRLALSPLYKETVLMKKPLTNYADYVSSDQANLYGSDLSRFSDLNLSPDFPTNARLMVALEELNFGVQVDGVLSMNEQALANFMRVTGPVTVKGKQISSENAVEYVTRGVYQDFENPKQKDAAVFSIIEKTFAKFQTGAISPLRILQAFIPAIHEKNLHGWAKEKSVQAKISRTPIGGSLDNLNNPTAAAVFINGAGNKLDAYVQADVVYDQGVCEAEFPFRDASMSISLQNTAPTSGLPAYVTTRFDLGTLTPRNPGATKMLVYLHVPLGSVFESAQIGSKQVLPVAEGTDMGREVLRFDLELPAQSTQKLLVKYAEPATGTEPAPTLWTQSMPNPVKTKVIAGLGCR